MSIPGGEADLVVTVRILTVQDGRTERCPFWRIPALMYQMLGVQVVHAGGSMVAHEAAQVLTKPSAVNKQARADVLD